MKTRIGILGATGYTGVELCRIIARHPKANISFLTSKTYAGKRIPEVFPELKGLSDHLLIPVEDAVIRRADLVFSCLPHGESAEMCMQFLERKIRVVDLSADFRLKSANEYKKWYGKNPPSIELLQEAVYGLTEINRANLKKTRLVANPGCFPTGIILALYPLLQAKAIETSEIIVDSKTGASGAGRSLKVTSLFAEVNENVSPYSIGRSHRHLSEIDQELSAIAGDDVEIIFSPHLIPMNRGILSTIYVKLSKGVSVNKIDELYQNAYRKEPFIRITGETIPQIKSVANTNYCDIGWTLVPNTRQLIIVSAIDNLLKGAAGQAVQNMNLMLGFDERAGLI